MKIDKAIVNKKRINVMIYMYVVYKNYCICVIAIEEHASSSMLLYMGIITLSWNHDNIAIEKSIVHINVFQFVYRKLVHCVHRKNILMCMRTENKLNVCTEK